MADRRYALLGHTHTGLGGGLENVVEDLTPELGGDLDTLTRKITSSSGLGVRIENNTTGQTALVAGRVAGVVAIMGATTAQSATRILRLATTETGRTGDIGQINSDTDIGIRSYMHGGHIVADGENALGSGRTLMDLSPNDSEGCGFYHTSPVKSSVKRLSTKDDGIVQIAGDSSGTTDSGVKLTNSVGTELGSLIATGATGDLTLKASGFSGDVFIDVNPSGTPTTVMTLTNTYVNIAPPLKDYSLVSTSPTSTAGALTLDIENGNSFQHTLTANTTVTISNPSPTGDYCEIIVKFVQDSTGSWTVTWPASVKWPGGTAPVITTTLTTGTDIISLKTWDAGTTWFGDSSQDYS